MPDRSRQSTCAALRTAALALLADDGIEAITVDRLMDRARVRSDEVTAYYPTVAACLRETYQEVADIVLAEFAAAFAEEDDWRLALRLATRRMLRRMAARPDEARLYFVEVLRGDRELLRRHVAARAQLVELCARELGRRARGENLPHIRVELLIGAGFHAIAAAVADGRLADISALEAELASRVRAFEDPSGISAPPVRFRNVGQDTGLLRWAASPTP